MQSVPMQWLAGIDTPDHGNLYALLTAENTKNNGESLIWREITRYVCMYVPSYFPPIAVEERGETRRILVRSFSGK